MNHDYEHCLDFCDDCPKACFRAQLSRDLENVPIWYPVSWMHFKGTEECKKREVTEEDIELAETVAEAEGSETE